MPSPVSRTFRSAIKPEDFAPREVAPSTFRPLTNKRVGTLSFDPAKRGLFGDGARPTASELRTAKTLGKVGAGPLWMTLADEATAGASKVERDAVVGLVRAMLITGTAEAKLRRLKGSGTGPNDSPAGRSEGVASLETALSAPSGLPGELHEPGGLTTPAYAAASVLADFKPEQAKRYFQVAENISRAGKLLGAYDDAERDLAAKAGLSVGRKTRSLLPSQARSTFDPAADVFRDPMGRVVPLRYLTDNPKLRPADQRSERLAMRQIREGSMNQEHVLQAQELAVTGLGPLQLRYADEVTRGMTPSEALWVKRLLSATMRAAGNVNAVRKLEYRSPRPVHVDHDLDARGPVPPDHSFPSGHSAIAHAAPAVLAHWAPERGGEFLSAAQNVARSRSVLGVHYLGDVAQGARDGLAVAQNIMELGT
ncbi:MAG: phosphatase PAP2 family protein [Myxococcaceae bacterium]